jgi:hypothetical protein
MPQSTNKQFVKKSQYPLLNNRGGFGSLALLISLLLIIAGMVAVVYNRQNILDWYKLQNYTAPTTISTLASQDTMTDYARRVFYVNQPKIDNAAVFVKDCPNDGGEQTIVLGCYHGGQNGIFLLSVSDPRLSGVQQVTAAHEMLHAAYARLSSSERKKVDGWLLDYYNHGLTDARVKATVDAYKKSEPHDVVNEMHSIFGTEVAALPANLEQYYTKYFVRRAAVTDFAAAYQAEFTNRQNEVARDDAQLAIMKAQIDALQSSLAAQLVQINTQRARLDSLQNQGDIAAYNAAVPSFNQLVDSYNAQLNKLRTLINDYNQLVSTRNSIAVQEDQLVKELSSPSSNVSQ